MKATIYKENINGNTTLVSPHKRSSEQFQKIVHQ